METNKENYLTKLFVNEAKPAMKRHSGGGGAKPAVLEPLSVTENGTYDPPEGVDGFKPVTVEIVDPPTGASVQDLINGKQSLAYLFYARLDTSMSQDSGCYIVTDELVERVMLGIDTSAALSAQRMFCDCRELTRVPLFDTSSVINMNEMLTNCRSLTTVPLFDTSSVKDMRHMLYGCSSLTTVPLFDTSSVTGMGNMLTNCSSLTTVPLFDTSSVTNMYEMFKGCSSLTTVPLFDTSSVTSMYSMFSGCSSLTTVPLFGTSSVTSMDYMFEKCSSLTTVPLFDTSSVTSMSYAFSKCSSLTTVPLFDARRVTNFGSFVTNCTALTEIWIRNIKANITVGSGTSYGHLLTVESLIHLIYELRQTSSRKKLTIGTANLPKLASVYVKQIEVTDEMRAEDDLVDEKLPFVVCESTDEGATLISEYVLAKNWELA